MSRLLTIMISYFKMKKRLLLFVVFVSLCLSCDRRPQDEHYYLVFENNSSYTVYVADHYWIWQDQADQVDLERSQPFHLPVEFHEIPAFSVNDYTIPLTYWLTYEYMFTKTNQYLVYVFPKMYDDAISWEEKKLVKYILTLDDLKSLNFHLSYPPDERMKGIEMVPAYSSFAHN